MDVSAAPESHRCCRNCDLSAVVTVFLKEPGGHASGTIATSHGDDDATIDTQAAGRDGREAAGRGQYRRRVFVFGQFVGDEPTSVWLVIVGLALWTALAAITLLPAGDEA